MKLLTAIDKIRLQANVTSRGKFECFDPALSQETLIKGNLKGTLPPEMNVVNVAVLRRAGLLCDLDITLLRFQMHFGPTPAWT